jgi:hypothetical protein
MASYEQEQLQRRVKLPFCITINKRGQVIYEY